MQVPATAVSGAPGWVSHACPRVPLSHLSCFQNDVHVPVRWLCPSAPGLPNVLPRTPHFLHFLRGPRSTPHKRRGGGQPDRRPPAGSPGPPTRLGQPAHPPLRELGQQACPSSHKAFS